jgi:hypothetical protein
MASPSPEHAGKTYRATHRVDTPGLPPLYCLREADAIQAAEERGGTSAIYLHGKHPKTGEESWDFWRSWP